MGAVLEVVSKVAVILILILIGCFITKRSMLTERGASEVTTVLIKLVTPCVIINSFIGTEGGLDLYTLAMAMALPTLWSLLGVGMSFLVFKKEPLERQKVLRFSLIFSNVGFMGIPLVQGIVGAFLVRIPVSLFMSRLEPVSLFRVGLATPCSTAVQIVLFLGCYAVTAAGDRRMEPAGRE